jgi:hypothetical protein
MRIVGTVVAASLLAAPPLDAQDTPLPRAGAFFVNVLTTGAQINPDIAADGADNFQVVWQSATGDPVHQDVRIRRVPASLTLPAEEPLAQSTALDQEDPRIAMQPDGDWVAIWRSDHDAEGKSLPIGRFTTSAGGVVEDELELTAGIAPNVVRLDAAWVGAENFVGAWRDSSDEVAANLRGIEGKDFGLSDVAVGANGAPAVAGLGDDGWVIAWHAPDASGDDAYLRCFAGELATMDALLAHTVTTGDQTQPDVASLGAVRFAAVWRDDDAIVGRLFLRREDGSCTPDGPQFEVSSPGDAGTSPRVAAAADGAFVVVWSESTLDTDGGVAAREFRHDGTPIGEPFAVHPAFPGLQGGPSVAVSASTFGVVWNHADDDEPAELDIAARIFFRRLAFSDGFESGNFARWSDTQP